MHIYFLYVRTKTGGLHVAFDSQWWLGRAVVRPERPQWGHHLHWHLLWMEWRRSREDLGTKADLTIHLWSPQKPWYSALSLNLGRCRKQRMEEEPGEHAAREEGTEVTQASVPDWVEECGGLLKHRAQDLWLDGSGSSWVPASPLGIRCSGYRHIPCNFSLDIEERQHRNLHSFPPSTTSGDTTSP